MTRKNINDEINNFINNIVYLRKKNGFSKKEMANILNISIYALNKIERGELPKKLSVKIVFNLQKHFKISPERQFEKIE
ncbi:MAG: helix-turn-helix transcriptional regulator [Ruminococcaceae bacterium]|nr:helix-turn-helix transcriptional regulator [Oscillospiraceae bacterium]